MNTPRFRICPHGLSGWIIEKVCIQEGYTTYKQNYKKVFFGLIDIRTDTTRLTEWDDVWKQVTIDEHGHLLHRPFGNDSHIVYDSKDAAKKAIDTYFEKDHELQDGLRKMGKRLRTVLPEEYP